MSVQPAQVADLGRIRELLRASGLPTEDVDAAGAQAHWVWREAGRVVGAVGLDLLGNDAVLRSLVTDAACRGRGIASGLCEAAEGEARRRGASRVYLLTETAVRFAEGRGYRAVDRSVVPSAVAGHRQFATGCCACAAALAKVL